MVPNHSDEPKSWSATDQKEVVVTVSDAVNQYNRFMGGVAQN